MSTLVSCPNPKCGVRVRMPDVAKTRVVCPRCRQVLADPASTEIPRPTGADAAEIPVAANDMDIPVVTPIDLEDVPKLIGRFRVKEKLGRGAFGVVYRAHDPQLNREVALKIPLPETWADPARAQRIVREAQLAAQLRHPHIVPLYDAGGTPPNFYIAFAFIRGRVLNQVLEDDGLDFRRKAQIARELAEALAYAHEQGIVHRDVKPANIMIDHHGKSHLMDFGMAYRADGQEKLTQAGMMVGTVAYMAPERVSETASPTTPANDQYSLGVVLYEMLCGRVPFEGPTEAVLYHAINTEPERPRRVRKDVPADLETICLKALAKKPADRYASCTELAEDLRSWLDGEPIKARRVGMVERTRKWCAKYPAMAVLTVASFLLLIAGTGVSTFFAIKAEYNASESETHANDALIQKARADWNAKEANAKRLEALESLESLRKEKRLSDQRLYLTDMASIPQYWQERNIAIIRGLLDFHMPKGPEANDPRQFEWYFWDKLCNTGIPLKIGDRGNCLAFSPNGKKLANSSQKNIEIWNWNEQRRVATLTGHSKQIFSIAFSPDGTRLASGADDKSVRVWDLESGKEMFSAIEHPGAVSSVAFTPDNKYLVSASVDKTIRIWDPKTGAEAMPPLVGHAGEVTAIAVSFDSKKIASASTDKTIKIWDLNAQEPKRTLQGHTGEIFDIVFSKDGKKILSASRDKTARFWDVESGQQIRKLEGHQDIVASARFAPNGIIASTSFDSIRFWDPNVENPVGVLEGFLPGSCGISFHPEGRVFAVCSLSEQLIRIFDIDMVRKQRVFPMREQPVESTFAVSPDGKRLAFGSYEGVVHLLDGHSGSLVRELPLLKQKPVTETSFSLDSKRLLAIDGDVRTWHADSGEAISTVDSNLIPRVFLGDELIGAKRKGNDWGMAFFDSRKGGITKTFERIDVSEDFVVGISRNAKTIAFGLSTLQKKSGIVVFDLDKQEKVYKADTETNFYAAALSNNGDLVGFANTHKSIKIVDLSTGKDLAVLNGHQGMITGVSFSSNAKRVMSTSQDKTIRIWDIDSGKSLLTLSGHSKSVQRALFINDDKEVVSCSEDKTIRFWPR